MNKIIINYGSKTYNKEIADSMFYETLELSSGNLHYQIKWNTNNEAYKNSYYYYEHPDMDVTLVDKNKFFKGQFDILIKELVNTIKEYRNIDPENKGIEAKLAMEFKVEYKGEVYEEKLYSLASLSDRPYIILDTLKRLCNDINCPMFLDRFDHEKNFDRDIFLDMI